MSCNRLIEKKSHLFELSEKSYVQSSLGLCFSRLKELNQIKSNLNLKKKKFSKYIQIMPILSAQGCPSCEASNDVFI